MRYEERDDDELAELAQAGWSPAFAVLVHRHGPALLAAFADHPDPVERTFEVFVRAMRRLDKRDASVPVRTWLFALAGREEPSVVPPPVEASLDHLWRDLAERWPDGRRPRRRHPILRGAAIAVGALALGVGVPTIVLGLPDATEEPPTAVRAEPLEDVAPDEPEPVDLPDFEFPDVDEEPLPSTQDPATPTQTEPTEPLEPTPAPAPEPAPAPNPAPAPQAPSAPVAPPPAPPPATEPEPEPDPPPPSTDDGEASEGDSDTSAGGEGLG